jgi:acyl-CoA synthetase (NDP forming)/GNAT superfamily N-acetyltransferase
VDDHRPDATPRPAPAHWEADVVLRDGSTAHLRPIAPADAERLLDFHSRLSGETLYFRYFAPDKQLSPRDIDQLVSVDHDRRVALVATLGGAIIAIGLYEGIDAAHAEVAFTVRDDHQARGLGSVLLEHLAAIARERGFQRFTAEIMPDNQRMIDVFVDAGYVADRREDDGIVSLAIDLEPTEAARRVQESREHRAESRSIARLLRPSSVLLVGASPKEGSFGHTLLGNLQDAGFTGPIHVVHPSAPEIRGVKAYPSVLDVPGEIDLAVVAVKADAVIDVVRQCGAKSAHAVVVISSGFADAGEAGRERQRELVHVARGRGMRVVGPNCLGVINTDPAIALNASLAPVMPPAGRIGFFSQSGALGIALLETVRRRGLGVSSFVGAGNRADVSGNDVLQYWDDDPATDVVLLYLESIGNPRKFTRLARRIARRKPIVAMKTGGSVQGRPLGQNVRATSLPPGAVDSLFRQSGVIQTETLNHLFDVSQVLAFQPLPDGAGLAIVSNSDALGVLAADAASTRGLDVVGDPVNLGADASDAAFSRSLAGVLEDPAVHAVLAIFVPPLSTAGQGAVDAIAAASRRSTKPVVATLVGSADDSERLLVRDAEGAPVRGSVPVFDSVEEAARALSGVAEYARWRRRPPGLLPDFRGIDSEGAAELVAHWLREAPDGRPLEHHELTALLGLYGIRLEPLEPVDDEEQAAAVAAELGLPVAVRVSARALFRRADLGTQRLNLETEGQVRTAFRRLRARFPESGPLVVHRMAPPGVACVVESVEDALFGPVVSFGVSGVATELLGDRSFGIPPLTDRDAADMVRAPRAAPLYTGADGAPASDLAALEDLLLRVSCLADERPELAMLRLEPVIAGRQGAVVLGASGRLARPLTRTETEVRRLTD